MGKVASVGWRRPCRAVKLDAVCLVPPGPHQGNNQPPSGSERESRDVSAWVRVSLRAPARAERAWGFSGRLLLPFVQRGLPCGGPG